MKNVFLTAIVLACICSSLSAQTPGDLVITEIMYNPPESGTDSLEYLEIYNVTNSKINLGGLILIGVGPSNNEYPIPEGISVAAKDRIVFCADSTAMLALFCINAYPWTGFGLSNSGETVGIKDSLGSIIDTVAYDDASPWTIDPDGNGSSLVLCNEAANNDSAANWIASTEFVTVHAGFNLRGTPLQACNTVPLKANFGSNKTCGNKGLNITFTDSSFNIGGSLTWSWTFPGGIPGSSSSQNPAVQYDTAGVYDVTLIVSNCIKSDTIKKTNYITVYTMSLTSSDVSNCGGSNGAATVSATNAVPPYTYLWSNGSTLETVTGLSRGKYHLTLTDTNGCVLKDSVAVYEPAGSTSVVTSDSLSCFGKNDGNTSLLSSGGTSPYQYKWSNGFTSAQITSLAAGTYFATVTDFTSCKEFITVQIFEPDPLLITADGNDISCFGKTDGSGQATTTGGTQPYSYSWSNAGTADFIQNLSAGNYIVTVTDKNSCSSVDSIVIAEPALLTGVVTNTNLSCNGVCNGSANISASGGTLGYTYKWSDGSNTSNITNICAGTYSVTIIDGRNCEFTTNAVITQPASLIIVLSKTNESQSGANDGSASVSASGGTPVYTYKWSNSSSAQQINNLSGGTYTVTVTDANGCKTSGNIVVSTNVGMGDEFSDSEKEFYIYPNPAKSFVTIKTNNDNAYLNIKLYSLVGQLQKTYSFYRQRKTDEIFIILDDIENGMYFLSVHSEKSVFSYPLIIAR